MDISEIYEIYASAVWECSPEDNDWDSLAHRNREQFVKLERALDAALQKLTEISNLLSK